MLFMDISDDKYAEYVVERIRKLGSNTTRWGLIFFIGLIYTLMVSIYPRDEFINNSVTIIHKFIHFDSLTTNKRKTRKTLIAITNDSFSSIKSRIAENIIDTSREQVQHQFDNLLSTIQKAEEFQKDSGRLRLKLLLDSTYKLKGKAKKNIKDTIKKYYLPIDIMIAMSGMQKQKALNQKDSLLNHADISFNVPELHTLDFGFRVGLVVWMILVLILMIYLFTTRLSIIRYLGDIYILQKYIFKENSKEWKKLDLQVPFWIAPLRFTKGNDKIFKALVGWKFIAFNNFMGIMLLVLILVLQLYVGWLFWHVSVMKYFENIWFQSIDIFLVCCTVFLFLLWLQPVKFSPAFAQTEHLSFKRREFIKLGLSSMLFFLLVPSFAKTVPIMKGESLRYKRKKKRLNSNDKINLADGFYSYKRNKSVMVYYCSGGKSPSRKSLSESEFNHLIPKLKKIDLSQILEDANMNQYCIPYWPSILEKEAYSYAVKDDLIPAITILLFSLSYSAGKGIKYIRKNKWQQTTFSNNDQDIFRLRHRLTSFLIGLILRAQVKLSESEKNHLAEIMKEKLLSIPQAVLKPNFMDFYTNNNYYLKKWQSSKKLHWRLPGKKISLG